jgi:beta-lactamase superfamily II metal-dependent hydrolase
MLLSAVSLFFALQCATTLEAHSQEPGLLIVQLNVGQGDAALAIAPGNKRVLIDAGRSDYTSASFLERLGIDTLHLVIASHNHADHIGGMHAVLSGFVVRAYLDNGIPHTTATYANTLAAIESSGAQYLNPTSRTIFLDSLRVRVIAPPFEQVDQNNGSVGVLFESGEFRALYTGDSEQRELEAWIRAGQIPRVTVLKAAHHGARNGLTQTLIAATRPRVVLISVGPNGYGHPAPEVELAWEESGARVYRTDLHGHIEVLANRDASLIVRTQSGSVDTIPANPCAATKACR